MYPLTHFLFPLVISLILVTNGFFNYYQAVLTALLGMMVDIDHYLHRVINYKDFNFRNCWNKAVTHKDKRERTLIHHEKGFILITIFILIILIFSSKLALIFAIAYYSHFLLDHIHIQAKRRFKFKEMGFKFNMPLYEIILNLALVIIILAITLNM